MKIIEVTSSTAQDNSAEIAEIMTMNLRVVRFLMRRTMLTIQAKNPASLSSPTRTIIPTRKRMTSSEENLIRFSKSMVLVISSADVPRKAKLMRKLQKNNVPRTETEKM